MLTHFCIDIPRCRALVEAPNFPYILTLSRRRHAAFLSNLQAQNTSTRIIRIIKHGYEDYRQPGRDLVAYIMDFDRPTPSIRYKGEVMDCEPIGRQPARVKCWNCYRYGHTEAVCTFTKRCKWCVNWGQPWKCKHD